MRNEVHDDNENTDSVVARRNRRRKQALAGVAGLAVLGAGAFLVTTQTSGDTEAREVAAGAPAPATAGSADAAGSAAAAAPAGGAGRAPSGAGPSAATPRTTKEQIAAVQGTAAKNTAERIRRPLPAVANAVSDSDLTVTTIGSLKDDKANIRVVSARLDLTGQRELSWAADKGEKVGDARCTQKIRVTPDQPPRVRPTFLLCWRTSESKSVYTVAVNLKGKPSAKESVAQIDKAWASLS